MECDDLLWEVRKGKHGRDAGQAIVFGILNRGNRDMSAGPTPSASPS